MTVIMVILVVASLMWVWHKACKEEQEWEVRDGDDLS